LREIFVSLQPRGKPARTDEEARKRAQDLVAKARAGADVETAMKGHILGQAVLIGTYKKKGK
jgi:phosphatidylethanolamine-binding protein (PEBP) family uncharacterized protein